MKRPLLTGLTLALGLQVLVHTVLAARFMVNDDVAIQEILSGVRYGFPSPHTFLVSPLLSAPLSGAYSLLPALPWFGILLYAFHWLATGIFLFLLLRRRRPPLQIAAFTLVLLYFEVDLLLRLSYTSTALLIGSAGILLVSLTAVEGSSKYRYATVGGLLVGAAFLLRSSVFPALAIWSAPLLWGVLRSRRRAVFAVFLGVVVLLVGLHALSAGLTWSGPEWDDWWTNFDLCFQVRGSPRLFYNADLAKVLDGIDWSRNDLKLFTRYFQADPEVFGNEKLSVLVERTADFGSRRSLAGGLGKGLLMKFRWSLLPLALCALALLPLLGRKSRLSSVAVLLLLGAGLAYLALFQRVSDRVVLPLLLGGCLWLCLAPPKTAERPRTGSLVRILGLCLFAAGVILAARFALRTSEANRADREDYYATQKRLDGLPEGSLVLHMSGSLSAHRISPLDPPPPRPKADRLSIGWDALSPDFRRRLEDLGMDNVFTAIARRPHTYLISNEPGREMVETFLREHSGVHLKLRPVGTLRSEPETIQLSIRQP